MSRLAEVGQLKMAAKRSDPLDAWQLGQGKLMCGGLC
jgi:hypothetical protein